MPPLSERDLRIQSRYNQLMQQEKYSTESHRIIGKEFDLSASRVRHILSDLKKVESTDNKESLPREVIPDGHYVKRQSTLVNASGDTEQQWIETTVKSKKVAQIQSAIPNGHGVKGISTYLDEEGNIRGQWIKTDREQQRWSEIIKAILEQIPKIIQPLPPVSRTKTYDNDLIALYPMADLHVGLYASIQDAETNWGISDAIKLIKTCVDDLVNRTPKTSRAVVANLGDFTHIDNLINRTPNNASPLDSGGRFIEVAQAAMEIAIYVIDSVARHHQNVTVIWQSGNHDEATALVLQTALATIYRNDARVHIYQSGKRSYCMKHGQVALGFTHGDTIKPQVLPLLMANDYPDIWASTRYRVWHCGHIHHRSVVDEKMGCFIESHQSPAPRDAWHEQRGYRSLHSMCSIVYDTIGEYTRNTVQIRI